MNFQKLFIILALLTFFYFISSYSTRTIERFTTQEEGLAQTILTFFQSPNTYIGYINLLLANENTFPNLAKIETYNAFFSKGNQLTTADILEKFLVQ
jgi:hypothetical protein